METTYSYRDWTWVSVMNVHLIEHNWFDFNILTLDEEQKFLILLLIYFMIYFAPPNEASINKKIVSFYNDTINSLNPQTLKERCRMPFFYNRGLHYAYNSKLPMSNIYFCKASTYGVSNRWPYTRSALTVHPFTFLSMPHGPTNEQYQHIRTKLISENQKQLK